MLGLNYFTRDNLLKLSYGANFFNNSFLGSNWMMNQTFPLNYTNSSTPEEEKRWKCDVCNKSYKYQSNLCGHKKFECSRIPLFQCQICTRRFFRKQHLNTHLKVIHPESVTVDNSLTSSVINNANNSATDGNANSEKPSTL
uniref:C2H2-type domain-containing protein n=2 Tax=Clastoptera arizonana TaxID=38151 RepID=A0A1B6CVW7_9HEMI